MNIMVVSEGKHEEGEIDRNGALLVLVERLLGHRADLIFRTIRDPSFGRVHGYEKRALRCFDVATREGFDGVIIVVDEDGDPRRRRIFDAAQDDIRLRIPRAMGIAVRTFDAWMLADEKALSEAIGEVIQQAPDPESIKDPKSRCARLCDRSRRSLSLTHLYTSVAGSLHIGILEKRCPKGFAPFAARVRALGRP